MDDILVKSYLFYFSRFLILFRDGARNHIYDILEKIQTTISSRDSRDEELEITEIILIQPNAYSK